MELPWYIQYPHKLVGVILLNSIHPFKVKDVFWYLDNDTNLEIYETLSPSPILNHKQYDFETLEFFNKIYLVLSKVITYSDNTAFTNDYLAAFAINTSIHKEYKERLFFFNSLKKVINNFGHELCLPASVFRCVDAIIADLIIIVDNDGKIINAKKYPDPVEEVFSFESNNVGNYDESRSNKTENIFTNYVKDMEGSHNTRKIILAQFDTLSSEKMWKYAFKDVKDLNIITELLTSFFTNEIEIKFPSEIIKLNLNTKTKVAACIKAIYSELGEGNLKNEVKLFKIIKCMSLFKNDTRDQIYKLMNK